MDKKENFKLKILIYFGYNGKSYHGLQYQKPINGVDFPTVESELVTALLNCNLITKDNSEDLQKNGWQRATRTDRGVHALANVINVKCLIWKKYLKNEYQEEAEKIMNMVDDSNRKFMIDKKKIINEINSNLSNQIRVFSIKHCVSRFDCKVSARSRHYEYIAPLKLFQKSNESDEQTISRVNDLCKELEGNHKFHNYSQKMHWTDKQAYRKVNSMICNLMSSHDNQTFVSFLIHGQSFIYHQIRKMIGIIIMSSQLQLENNFIEETFSNKFIDLWLAPPDGLFLKSISFDGYNTKHDIPEKLVLSEEEEQFIQNFKAEIISPLIIESEIKDKVFSNWLNDAFNNKIQIEEEIQHDKEE